MDDPEGPSDTKTGREAPSPPNHQQTADYIADAAFELRNMANGVGLPFLTYLLEMVAEEATRESGKPR